MGKGSSSPPPAPDPAATAAAQGAANKEAVLESAKVNQFNQQTPFGNLTYTGDIGSPDRTQIQTLSPAGQQQLDYTNQLANQLLPVALQRAGDLPTGNVDFSGLQGLPGLGDFGAERDKVESALFDRSRSLLDPVYDERYDRSVNQLANQGLPVGSQAYGSELDRLSRERTDAYSRAAQDAVIGAGTEQSRLYNQAVQGRQQGINELLTQRSIPINEISAILQGSPATNLPQFGQAAQYQVAPADLLGAQQLAYQGQLAGFNAGQQRQQGLMSGLFGLGAAGITALSSRAVKHMNAPVTVLDGIRGLNIERWTYRPGIADEREHIGPYAEEFRDTFGVGDGVTINLIDMLGVLMAAVKELAQEVEALKR